ncbi:iron transporter (plasmid) [Deinococcus psychrotolerans]|uniref:Iron transporter n=1 Tax=Deinococcus psychrotolerans TaxID=2489213 RepID=A0A3G8YIB8_9DEIO|nr:VIT1/CCC1 transporter family protein [Deinococcus psychrotolerans]AZI45019.1 iron transporter [Deinococcus psychrotolerans]
MYRAVNSHRETHFTGSEMVRDIVIGMSDGLTVPFALAAGLSGAVASGHVVLIAGIAEMAAGSIAMGLGGYLAARSEHESYVSERAREEKEIDEKHDAEIGEVRAVFQKYGLTGDPLEAATQAITSNRTTWVDFMMKEELGLEEPDPKRALRSALTIGLAYIAGGVIPLTPYALNLTLSRALLLSVVLTLIALFAFGALKGRFTGSSVLKSAVQTMFVGAVASGTAFLIARLVSGSGGL